MRHITTRELHPERIDLAFPLLQTSMPEMTLPRWQSFAHRALAGQPDGGARIMTAENERGILVGLVVFRVFNDLRHGLALQVEHFLAVDLFDREPIVQSLAAALEEIAAKQGCGAIHTALPDRPADHASSHWLAKLLHSRGHSVEGLFLCKPLLTG